MIHIRINITLPLIFLLLFGLVLWLIRDPDCRQQQPTRQRTPPRPHPRSHACPTRTIIFTGDDEDHDPPEHISYEDALRSGRYSPEELEVIGNREALEAGRTVFEQTKQTLFTMPVPNWRK
jgi:hypothetical protein